MRKDSHRTSTLLGRVALAAAATLGPLTAASAQQGAWYTVELIVFEQLEGSGLYAERWPLDPGRPAIEGARELVAPGAPPAVQDGEGSAGAAAPGRRAFEMLDDDELSLRETWSRLRRSRGFRPLLHVGWRQPGYSRARAPTAHLSSAPPGSAPAQPRAPATLDTTRTVLAPPPEKIDGVVRLYRSRYLHLEADLLYHRGESTVTAIVPATDGALSARSPTVFRMTTSRRMRSRELHYLDHPLFGVIVLVTPVASAPAAEGPEEPVTTPLPPAEAPQPAGEAPPSTPTSG